MVASLFCKRFFLVSPSVINFTWQVTSFPLKSEVKKTKCKNISRSLKKKKNSFQFFVAGKITIFYEYNVSSTIELYAIHRYNFKKKKKKTTKNLYIIKMCCECAKEIFREQYNVAPLIIVYPFLSFSISLSPPPLSKTRVGN